MALQPEPPVLDTAMARWRSWLIKIAGICLIIAVLHIPLAMTRGVVRERHAYQTQATAEISGIWGREQRVTGPVLAVPYTYKAMAVRTKIVNGQSVQVDEPALFSAVAYFLPDDLKVDGVVDPEIRRRGIYEAVVYTARLKFSGILRPDFARPAIEPERILWEKARVLFGVTDLHGLRSIAPLRYGEEKEAAFESVEAGGSPFLPLAANVGASGPIPAIEFAFEAVVQGSGIVAITPVGKNTAATLRSAWRDPSFMGAWLPTDRRVSGDGFTAEWRVAHFSRGFPQSWTSRAVTVDEIAKQIDAAAFGVRFARGVDSYSIVERAQKYGVLFFALIFAVFFLFEIVSELRIHPLQYAMVGAALCLFFLGFLALTELWTTALAYSAAAGACTGLVSLYSWSFLQTGLRTLVVVVGLAATYGYLYFVLKSQDYALIAGTAALFVALALAMFCTRRINWYSFEAPDSTRAGT